MSKFDSYPTAERLREELAGTQSLLLSVIMTMENDLLPSQRERLEAAAKRLALLNFQLEAYEAQIIEWINAEEVQVASASGRSNPTCTSGVPMNFAVIPPAQTQAITDRAIRQGRHSAEFRAFCQGCQKMVGSIYHVTIDRLRLCPDCADKIGCGPNSFREWQARQEQRIAAMRAASNGGTR
jgi:hypothetical protein